MRRHTLESPPSPTNGRPRRCAVPEVGVVTARTAPLYRATVVIRPARVNNFGYLAESRGCSPRYSCSWKRRDREYQRTTVGRVVEMCRIMPTSCGAIRRAMVPVREAAHRERVSGGSTRPASTTHRCSGRSSPAAARAYQRPGAADLLAGSTLFTIYDFLGYNDGEVLEYLGNGKTYPVIDTHAHHYYNLTRNFDGTTFGGGGPGRQRHRRARRQQVSGDGERAATPCPPPTGGALCLYLPGHCGFRRRGLGQQRQANRTFGLRRRRRLGQGRLGYVYHRPGRGRDRPHPGRPFAIRAGDAVSGAHRRGIPTRQREAGGGRQTGLLRLRLLPYSKADGHRDGRHDNATAG